MDKKDQFRDFDRRLHEVGSRLNTLVTRIAGIERAVKGAKVGVTEKEEKEPTEDNYPHKAFHGSSPCCYVCGTKFPLAPKDVLKMLVTTNRKHTDLMNLVQRENRQEESQEERDLAWKSQVFTQARYSKAKEHLACKDVDEDLEYRGVPINDFSKAEIVKVLTLEIEKRDRVFKPRDLPGDADELIEKVRKA